MNNFELYKITVPMPDPQEGPLYAVLPTDGTRGFIVGEEADVEELSKVLLAGKIAGELDQLDPRVIGGQMTTDQAAGKYDVPATTVRWAAREGQIRGAIMVGKSWAFSERAFLSWYKTTYKPRNLNRETWEWIAAIKNAAGTPHQAQAVQEHWAEITRYWDEGGELTFGLTCDVCGSTDVDTATNAGFVFCAEHA